MDVSKGMGMEDDTSDPALLRAIRKRLLDEIGHRGGSDAAAVVNNIYGGHIPSGAPAGVSDRMSGQPSGEDPRDYDYMVDIIRKDLADKDPDTGKPVGWEKSVHRYRNPKP
jgi:hypothetical protein